MLPPEGWPTAERVTLAYATFRGVVPGVHYAHLTLPPPSPDGARAPVVLNLHGGFWKSDWGLHSERTTRELRIPTAPSPWGVE